MNFFFCNWTSLFELKKKIVKFQASAYSIINNTVGLLEKLWSISIRIFVDYKNNYFPLVDVVINRYFEWVYIA